MRLQKVDPAKCGDILTDLQLRCLPSDVPTEYKAQDSWWLVLDDGYPVGFAGVRNLGQGIWYLCRAGVVYKARGHGLQKRLIRARVAAARKGGGTAVISDCTAENAASANSLIAAGFRLYTPAAKWGLPTSLYWRLNL